MKERPILFNGEMVCAVLDDRKTKTRRVVKPQPDWPDTAKFAKTPYGGLWSLDEVSPDTGNYHPGVVPCPYGSPGDRLYVRETFLVDLIDFWTGPIKDLKHPKYLSDHIYYRADGECCDQIPECCCHEYEGKTKWRPSIHMPKALSRILLEVVSVRVERVQEISGEDARAEGCPDKYRAECPKPDMDAFSREWFYLLWERINAKRGYGWDANPWVWVVEFKRIKL